MSVIGAPSWRGTPVLVTGGTGFLGVNLVGRLVADGAAVTIVSRRADAAATPGLPAGVRVERADVRDAAALRRAVEGTRPRVVFHLASTAFNPPGTSDQEHHDVIVGGTTAVLSAVAASGARFVHAGSAAEYGSGARLSEDHPLEPTTALGRAKADASRVVETAARELGVDAVVLRLFTPYGPWDRPGRLVIQTALNALDTRPIRISDGRQQRDLVFVDDAVSAFLLAGLRPLPRGAVYNVSSGTGVSVRDVVDLVVAHIGSSSPVLVGALATRPDEIWELTGDNTAAARDMGWRPATDLGTGIAATCAWVREHRGRLARALEPSLA